MVMTKGPLAYWWRLIRHSAPAGSYLKACETGSSLGIGGGNHMYFTPISKISLISCIFDLMFVVTLLLKCVIVDLISSKPNKNYFFLSEK